MPSCGRMVAVGIVLLLAYGCASSSAAKPGSGITGRVLIGPTCPVERSGQSCVRPYGGAVLIVGAVRGRRVASVRAGTSGYFRVRLAAGRYLLKGAAGLPRLAPVKVIVHRGRFTKVTLTFDSGIR